MGLTEPTEGTARVAGHDPTREPLAVKRIIGYLPDNVGFYEELTGRENLRYTARLNKIPPAEAEERIGRLLDRVGLGRVADDRVGTYSRGMIQRLGIADVLVKDPRVVILDEPTNGIDPEGIREVLELIHGLSREDGRTVLISSHLLHQVQQICDRVGIFVEGRLVAAGPIESLGEQLLAGQPVMLEVQAQPGGERLRAVLEELEGIQRLENKADYLLAYCTEDIRSRLVEHLHNRGFALLHLRRRGYSLDDIYRMYFTRGGGRRSMKIPGKKPWPFARGNSSWEGVGVIFRKELADHLNSRRFNILALLVLVTGIASIYAASKGISQAGEDVDFVFLRLFTSGGIPCPPSSPSWPSWAPWWAWPWASTGSTGKGPGGP